MEMAESTYEPAPGKADESERLRRSRTYSAKGKEQYEQRLLTLNERYENTWRQIDKVMFSFNEEERSSEYLRDIDNKVQSLFKEFLENSSVIVAFLTEERSELASQELSIHKAQCSRKTELVKKFRNQIDSFMLSAAEARSERLEIFSNAGSHTSSLRVQKQLARSAEKAQLKFLDQEVELQKQRAIADIELKALQQRKKSAVADAEATVVETLDVGFDELPRDVLSQPSLRQVKIDRVADYVANSQYTAEPRIGVANGSRLPERPEQQVPDINLSASQRSDHTPSVQPPSMEAHSENNQSIARGLSSYLLKKDLLMSRFTAFKDTAQHYSVWKASFQSVVNEMGATSLEQLDLLTKWLGPDSKEFAISIHATNIAEPTRALQLIWSRLEQMYGRPETKERELSDKVTAFPVLTDSHADRIKYLRLVDLLTEIESAMNDERFANMLSYYNSSKGVLPITQKLPKGVTEKWSVRASQYKTRYNVMYPPFSYFVQYVREVSERKNDPSFYPSDPVHFDQRRKPPTRRLNVRKSFLSGDTAEQTNSISEDSTLKRCPIHSAAHTLTACRSFLAMSLNQRRDLLKKNNLCFKCCIGKHRASKCTSNIKCEKCSSDRHVTCMHYDPETRQRYGGEKPVQPVSTENNSTEQSVSSKCSRLCGDRLGGRSCGKVVLVNVYHDDQPERAIRMYAIIDDQSNRTLARSKFFDMFNVESRTSVFTMSSCSGSVSYSGRSATNFIVEPISGKTQLRLPKIIECDEIPDNVNEIPTPEVALAYPHLVNISQCIPDLDPTTEVLLLIGRDIPRANHVIEQIIGLDNEPFGQRLHLGWTIVGEVCLGGMHRPNKVSAMKTHVLGNGRSSLCKPCDGQLTVLEGKNFDSVTESATACSCCDIFKLTPCDETPGLSTEDRQFISLMREKMVKEDGKWIAPLPFRRDRVRLPNNRSQALRRANVLHNSFRRDIVKRDHAFEFMDKVFQNGHAERTKSLEPDKECWYLLIFSVYHPQKPNKIRMVFDSSAKFENVSLNSVLLSGPELTNSLTKEALLVHGQLRLHKIASNDTTVMQASIHMI